MIDTNIDAIEKLHLSFLKGLLKVRKQTPTLAVYGELGRHPVAVDFENKSLIFGLRVSNRKDGDLARKILDTLQNLSNRGHTTWLSNTRNSLQKLDLTHLQTNPPAWDNKIKSVFKGKLIENYKMEWGAKTNDVERNPKLRTDRDFKTTVKFEPYLKYTISKM